MSQGMRLNLHLIFPSVFGGSANLVKKEAKFCKLYLEWKRARAKHSLMVHGNEI